MKKSDTNTPKIYEINGRKYALINEKLVPIEQQQQKERDNISLPVRTKKDITELLNAMNKETSIAYFGFMVNNKKESPYAMVGISKFFRDNNIQIDVSKHERVGFTYEQKHNIILKQLQGESTKTFNNVKKNCVESIQKKLTEIPNGTQRNGKPLTEKQKSSMTTSITAEILRWQNVKQ